MTDRDRLIELIGDKPFTAEYENYNSFEWAEHFADYLLANGIVVLDTGVISPKNRPLITHFADMPINDVLDLVRAKREGRLIVPPCKVGNTVYSLREVSCEDIDEAHTECEFYGFGTDDRICQLEKPQKCPYRYRVFKCLVTEYNLLSFARQWGKTVFLTKEEAEQALAERE